MKNNYILKCFKEKLEFFKSNPQEVTEQELTLLQTIFFMLHEPLKFSHSNWKVDWKLFKFANDNDTTPYEVLEGESFEASTLDMLAFGGNIITDGGANEMLKLIVGDSTATSYNNANAKIYVGTDSTAENATQTGVIATGSNRAYANMETGYPLVQGRSVTFRASFGNDSANFNWNEASITNGTGAGAVALNRKVQNMGTKNGGTWTLQVQISVLSA